MWVGFKAVSETVESGQSVELLPDRPLRDPGLRRCRRAGCTTAGRTCRGRRSRSGWRPRSTRSGPSPTPTRSTGAIYGIADARYGFVTTGKGHLDLMEALRLLGLDEAACRRLGIDIYKVGMVWPLARHGALDFVREKEEVLVVEEKRGDHREPAQGVFLRLSRPQAAAHGRQARRGGRAADPLDRRADAAAAGAAGGAAARPHLPRRGASPPGRRR